MPTVENIARAALGDLAVDQNHLLNGVRWVNDRYAEFAATVRLKQLRRTAELTIPAVVTAGTVSVTQSSTTVTGNATAIAAWSITMTGRFFQIDRVWYRIAAVNLVAGTLTLEEPYSGTSDTGLTYKIVAQIVLLKEDARQIVGFIHERFNRGIVTRSLQWMNMLAPERFYNLGGPQAAVDLGEDPVTHRRQIEFYPYSDEPEHILYRYYAKPPILGLEDELPAGVDQGALKEGVLIDVMRWKMARALDAGMVDVGNSWRNEYRAQNTLWMGILQRMVRTDDAIDDATWITRSTQGMPVGDITTAQDQVIAAGQRP